MSILLIIFVVMTAVGVLGMFTLAGYGAGLRSGAKIWAGKDSYDNIYGDTGVYGPLRRNFLETTIFKILHRV